jgi:hypothetical protein
VTFAARFGDVHAFSRSRAQRSAGMPTGFEKVLDAYRSLGEGDPSQLIEVLHPRIEWRAKGVNERGKDAVAERLFGVAGRRADLVGVRRTDETLLLEFTRPWWKPGNRTSGPLRSLFGIRGEQLVWIEDGLVWRIESRERLAHAGDPD